MLSKLSVLMMLLLVVASLVGISSIYTPANVETQTPTPQPQPQPQKPQTTLDQKLQGGITTPQSKIVPGQPVADQKIVQAMNDRALLNRLMPQIIDRMQVTLNFRDNYSPLYKISKDALASESYHKAEARCPPGFRVTGGGGQISGVTGGGASLLGDNGIVTLMPIPSSRLDVVAKMETSGSIMAYANCLGVEAVVSLRK
jgi:hypothetical protein